MTQLELAISVAVAGEIDGIEMGVLVLTAIQSGLVVDEHTIPDISVGMAWSTFWVKNGLDIVHGQRGRHRHVYPSYYPQSQASGIEPWVYPEAALGAFRAWLRAEYLPHKFGPYLDKKVAEKVLSAPARDKLLKTVSTYPALPAAGPAKIATKK